MVNNGTPHTEHLMTGRIGEAIAEKYLCEKGYKIIGRNEQTGRGEIDIIARDGGVIVFVEVKTKTSDDGISPLERVDYKKIGRLRAAAETWLDMRSLKVCARIDVIGVCQEKVMEHYEDVTGGC